MYRMREGQSLTSATISHEVQMGCKRNDAHLNSAGVPVKLLFLTRSSKKFVEESVSLKTFKFFPTNLIQRFPHIFHRCPHPSKEQQLSKTISISPDNDVSPLRRYISDVVICLFISLTSMKTGNRYINICIYLYN